MKRVKSLEEEKADVVEVMLEANERLLEIEKQIIELKCEALHEFS